MGAPAPRFRPRINDASLVSIWWPGMDSSSEANCLPFEARVQNPDGFRSKGQIEGPAALSWRIAQTKHALVCKWNLCKIDHFLALSLISTIRQ
jgi:hypothetical protein